jgi:hypothetical protein
VISTVGSEARHTRKSPSNRRDGYRAHLMGEPETGLITDEQLTQAAGADNADAAVAAQFLARTGPQASTPQDNEPQDNEPLRDASCGEAADEAPADEAADNEAADNEAADNEAADNEAADNEALGAGRGTRKWPGTATRPTAPGSSVRRLSGPDTVR